MKPRYLPRKGKKKLISTVWRIFAIFWGVFFLFFILLWLGWLSDMPSFEELENPKSNQASEVISEDGVILGFIGVENRSDVGYSEISPNLINALIATEDVRFYDHSGIDPRSLLRVAIKTVLGGKSSSGGGSTITQQLAKNLFRTRENGATHSRFGLVFSKFKEWVVAVKLEHNYSKEEILSMYLNTVDFGSNSLGIKTASRTFFATTPDKLSVPEAATLVGLLKAPTAYSPVLHPDRSLVRRNTVLAQMLNYDYITQEEYDSYCREKIDITHYTPQSHNDGTATYLREYIREYMKGWCKQHRKVNGEYYDVHRDGLRIYTAIDSRMQRYAEEAVAQHLRGEIQPAFNRELAKRNGNPFCNLSDEQVENILTRAMKDSDRYRAARQNGHSEKEIRKIFDKKVEMRVFDWQRKEIDTILSPWDSLLYYKKFLNAGMMSVEPGTGHVKVYVGGINYRYFKYDNVRTNRQVGSTFKPFVYTMALQDLGMFPCTEVPNTEVCFSQPGQADYCPKNSSHEREGEMVTLKWALAHSINWVSAYLVQQGNPQDVVEIARKMGVRSPIDAVPSICCGTPELTVQEMAAAMATYPNHGEFVEPIIILRITDNRGNILEEFTPERNPAINEKTAYMMLLLMQGVVQSGTGTRLNYKYHLNQYSRAIAGKTGTTQNNSDCWFVGITPKLATAVWTGGEVRSIHFRNMTYGQGASMALPIFGYFLERVYQDGSIGFYRGEFERPSVPLDVELDCSRFQQEIQNEVFDPIHDEYSPW